MDSDSSIVLSSISSDLIVSFDRHYDPTARFVNKIVGENQGLPSFSIHDLVAEFNKDHDAISKITLPVLLFTRKRFSPEEPPLHPGMWETRYIKGPMLGTAVVIGNKDGQRMRNHHVLQVRYPTKDEPYQKGRRVLVSCLPGSLMTCVLVQQYKEIYFTYVIDEVLPWPKHCNIYQPPERDSAKIASANLSLVSVYIKDKFHDPQGWNDPSLSKSQLLGIMQMQDAAFRSVEQPTTTPRYIEHFVSANQGNKRQQAHAVGDDDDVRIMKTEPDDFMATVHDMMNQYRRALMLDDNYFKNSVIPVNATYEITWTQDDQKTRLGVIITLEVPSVIQSQHSSFAIEAEFFDLPHSLSVEPSLTYAATTFEDFVNLISQDGYTKNLFCKI